MLFPLCRTCAEIPVNSILCDHDREEDGEFVGTWVSIELFEAMKSNYQLKRRLRGMAFSRKKSV